MADEMKKLLELPESAKEELGALHTPREIAQQPFIWRDTAARFGRERDAILAFLKKAKALTSNGRIVMTGAGTSAYVGICAEPALRTVLKAEARAVPSTDIVTHPQTAFIPKKNYLLVNFARSGNSPESVGSFRFANETATTVHHLAITCNKDGKLAEFARQDPEKAYAFILHEKSNDESLVMTSSFSGMLVAALGLAHIKKFRSFPRLVEKMAKAGERMLSRGSAVAKKVAALDFKRAVYLGSGALYGAAVESALKIQESTSGDVISAVESFVGLRHGPQAVIHDDTLVVAFVSSDPYVRRYELDLLKENHAKGLGMRTVAVTTQSDEELAAAVDDVIEVQPRGKSKIPDIARAPVDTIFAQMLGMFKSMAFGYRPDAPSKSGVIHRVVEGISVYDREKFMKDGVWEVFIGR
ncbi:MAG: SIS domain-containing protein [Planctomycetes bacterium]|nr:SIS domain-containing protein [Planctomycetota bacterium]